MTLSMYQASVPVFLRGLQSLSGILAKGAADAAERKIDPIVFLTARLAPDMFPLTRQVQIACDHAKGATARLAGVEVPKFEDVETSFEELQRRLTRVMEFIQTFEAGQIDDGTKIPSDLCPPQLLLSLHHGLRDLAPQRSWDW